LQDVLAGLVQDSLWLYGASRAAELAAAAYQLAHHMCSQDSEGGPDVPGALLAALYVLCGRAYFISSNKAFSDARVHAAIYMCALLISSTWLGVLETGHVTQRAAAFICNLGLRPTCVQHNNCLSAAGMHNGSPAVSLSIVLPGLPPPITICKSMQVRDLWCGRCWTSCNLGCPSAQQAAPTSP
jgi:hypothetical protein